MKVFAHGQSNGAQAVGYVIDPKRKGREESPPQVLRGDPEMVQQVIGSTDRKWKYTSGVLSWAPEDKVSPEVEHKVMDDFEKIAFAGMESDQYSILWVRHSHAGHHELHFIIPRTELHQDKAMNPCPPGWQKQYDVWRDLWNERMEWARPDDPKRARISQPGKAIQFNNKSKAEFKEQITNHLAQGIMKGIYQNRNDLIQALESAGFAIPRKGKNYITLESPQDGQRIRMKGGIYAASWRAEQQIKGAGGFSIQGDGASRTERISRLERELEEVRSVRAEYHFQRYGGPSSGTQEKAIQDLGPLLETKHFGELRVRTVVGHNISLCDRILRMENQGKASGVNKHQRANSNPEEERKQIYEMGHQRLPERQSEISGLPQRDTAENCPDKQRPASRFTYEVNHERVKSELIGDAQTVKRGAKAKAQRSGSQDSRARTKDFRTGAGGPRLSGFAKRIGRCFERVGGVVRAFARRAVKTKQVNNQGPSL